LKDQEPTGVGGGQGGMAVITMVPMMVLPIVILLVLA
jgi:hypothetical protein